MRISDWSSDVCSSDLLGVVPGAGELVDDLAVVVEAKPGEAVEDGIDGFRGRALAIGVLDAQPVAAAVVPGIEPVEQRGARAADVQEAGRRGRKARHDGTGSGHRIFAS